MPLTSYPSAWIGLILRPTEKCGLLRHSTATNQLPFLVGSRVRSLMSLRNMFTGGRHPVSKEPLDPRKFGKSIASWLGGKHLLRPRKTWESGRSNTGEGDSIYELECESFDSIA